MGKRELVLIAVFVLLGVVVYQFTAAPLPAGQEGFSVSRVFQNVRRNIAGRRASQVVQTSRTEAVDASISELRINVRVLDLTVTGEDRPDAAFEFQVESNGLDDADARDLAQKTALKIERAGAGLNVSVDFPREGLQRATLKVRVPKRLALRVEGKTGRLEASNLAAVDVKGNRGDTRVRSIAGDVTVSHRTGELAIEDVGTLRLDGIAGSGTIAHVRGACSLSLNRASVTVSAIVGPLDVKTVGTDLKLRELASLRPPMRADLQSGSIDVEGLQSEARIDGRNTEIAIAMQRAVPLTVDNTGDDIHVTAPAGGYTVDAVAIGGNISVEDGALAVSGDDREHRASGPIRGGGPTFILRSTRGDVVIDKR